MNNSPYTFSILPMSKKDGSWCVCVDDRAITNNTGKYQFLVG